MVSCDSDKEAILWKKFLAGNREAQEELYRFAYPILLSYGLKLIPDRETVRDCIEELFVRLIQNHRKLPEVISLRSYLLRAFRNKLIDELRCPNQTVSLEENPETYFADSSIEELLNQQEFEERKRKLLLSLKMLPARQREILWLYYAEGLKHEEIAEGMQINYQSSKNLLFRAIVKLRELYFSLKGWILFFTIPYLS